jgi:hypothetical protein
MRRFGPDRTPPNPDRIPKPERALAQPPRRPVDRPPPTAALSPVAVLGLQRRAGNAAVRRLLAPRRRPIVQRAPFATPPAAAPVTAAAATDDLSKRLDEAKKLVGTAGWYGKAVTQLYAAKPRSVDDLTKEILTTQLLLPEIVDSTASIDAKLKPAADRLRGGVTAGVKSGLNATMVAIGAAIPGRAAELEPFVTTRMQNKLWTFGDLVTEAWDHWLECTPYPDVSKIAWSAGDTRKALETAVAAAVKAYSTKHFTGAALSALSGPPRDAAKAWIEPRATWVSAPADLETLTDTVLTATKVAFKDHTDPAWVDMRSRITDFVIAAETDIIKAEIDKNWTTKTTEEVWALARGMYMGTMDKPVWKFYKEDVQSFTLFGHTIDKSSGMHPAVIPELTRVEASAKRLAGAEWAKTSLPAGYGFRFQPQEGNFAQNAHVSLHATARAIDLDAVHNPFTSGGAKNLAGFLGGVDFEGGGNVYPGFGELAKLGADIDAKYAKKAELETKLKGNLTDEEKGAAEQELKDVQAAIDALPDRADVKSIRDRAGQTYDSLVKAQTEFLTAWKELTGGTNKAGDIDVKKVVERLEPFRTKAVADLAPVDAKTTALNEKIEDLKKQSGELKAKGKDADPATVADVKAKLAQTQNDLEPLRAEKRRLDDQIKRVSDLEKRFDAKGDGKKLLTELESTVVKGGGFTNMPKWMVQAFAENGFTWGGGWHAPEDAMHFSSMTPINGVIQPGMG